MFFISGAAPRFSRKNYLKYKGAARAVVFKKFAQFASVYPYPRGRVSIRNQRTRWGSCSRKGNLNFNYRILFLPEKFQDYIIVHELCHLAEFNHSPGFWELVARTVPDHAAIRRELRRKGMGPW